MKKNDVSRLEQMRSINLKIGYVVALCLMLAAFSWTTDREVYQDLFDDNAIPVELEITRTYQKPKAELPPPPKPTVENKIIIESKVPEFISTEIELTKAEPTQDISPNNTGSEPPTPVKPPLPKPEIVNDEIPFVIVEDMPLFGKCYDASISKKERKLCSDSELMNFLATNLRYPAIARENGVEGMVVISFIIEKDGSISKPEIKRDIGAGCGQEALRVLKLMPEWRPGMQRGRKVRVQYNLPVRFKLH